MAEKKKYTGVEKAAILMLAVGDELASEVMRRLDDREIHSVGNYMTFMGNVPSDDMNEVAREFFEMVQSGEGGMVAGGKDYVKKILEKSLDPSRVNEVMARLSLPGEEDTGGGLENIRVLDPKTIANFLANEHPQTGAIVLAHLDPAHAADTLRELPERFQPEVAYRMATLDRVPPGVIKELDEALAIEFRSTGAMEGAKIGGVQALAEVINNVDHTTETNVLSEIETINPELAESIRELMFVFEDLVKLDDRSMQALLKEVNSQDLILALKTASEELKAKVFKNMSERAAVMMKEDLEAMGPARLSDVQKSQQAILKITKKMEEEGKVILAGAGEQLV
jgi:flagellar motor switch protein FliG